MRCDQSRVGLSARLDGEDPGVPDQILDRHLSGCRECRVWLSEVEAAGRLLRVRAAEAAPDLSMTIVAAAPERPFRTPTAVGLLRAGLVGVAGVQLWLAAPSVLSGAEHGGGVHVGREFGSCHVALAIGFLVAAVRPRRLEGLLALVTALAVVMVSTTEVHVVRGHIALVSQMHHLPTLAGLAVLWCAHLMVPRPGDGSPGRSHGRLARRRLAA